MKYLSVYETARKWGLSERSVRNYCNQGRVPGAILTGKTWMIPRDAIKPVRKGKKVIKHTLLDILKVEKESKTKGGIYHKIQIELTYNSNHIEGSRLTYDQTRFIYETNTIGLEKEVLNIDDIVETANHFRCVDLIIDKVNYEITEGLIKELHMILKNGTTDSRKSWFSVGNYKKLPNEVGGKETTKPEDVQKEMRALLDWYKNKKNILFNDIVEFHYRFECIHPFQDGNGRVGRLIMFKECLKHNIVPFIIDENLKLFYYRGLKEWPNEKGYLIDTCLSAQDKFKNYLDYFRIDYKNNA
ncbi:MAG: Fic family protein [Bacilli bacterium]